MFCLPLIRVKRKNNLLVYLHKSELLIVICCLLKVTENIPPSVYRLAN